MECGVFTMSRRSVILRVESLEERLVPSTVSTGPLPQAVSDQLLAGVMPVLTNLESSLSGAYYDYNGHKGTAMLDILLANRQLDEALVFVGSSQLVPVSTTSIINSQP